MHSMLQMLAATLLLVSPQTPESQFEKHSGDNPRLREDYYQGADRYRRRFRRIAKTLPRRERDALIRSEKQARVVFDRLDTYSSGVGHWGTIILDYRPPNIYQLEEDYLNAARYVKAKNPRYLKSASGHNGDKKWAHNMVVLEKWVNDKDASFMFSTRKECLKDLAALKQSWTKFVAGLPPGPTLQNFLKWSLADAVSGGSFISEEGIK